MLMQILTEEWHKDLTSLIGLVSAAMLGFITTYGLLLFGKLDEAFLCGGVTLLPSIMALLVLVGMRRKLQGPAEL